jgi:hypothetical protein
MIRLLFLIGVVVSVLDSNVVDVKLPTNDKVLSIWGLSQRYIFKLYKRMGGITHRKSTAGYEMSTSILGGMGSVNKVLVHLCLNERSVFPAY